MRRVMEAATPLRDVLMGTGELAGLVRYFVAGVAVSAGYTVTVIALVEWLWKLSPEVANIVGIVVWTPVSYVAHKNFTFRFTGANLGPMLKFAATFVAKLVASVAVVWLAHRTIGVSYIVGVLANWIVLPLITYVVLRLWVFESKVDPADELEAATAREGSSQ